MFIGHYAVALAVKRVAPRTSLGTLFAAASLADLLWPVFLLFGWEQAHVVPGPNPFLTLWLDSIPISHSLITLIGWGALFAYLYRVRTGDGRAALVVALLVVSHWLLDFVTHRPDMAVSGRHAAGARAVELRRGDGRRRGSDVRRGRVAVRHGHSGA